MGSHTEQALISDEFLTLERSIVESVVKRNALEVKEVDLFKAVDRWATKELERQGLTPRGEVKRKVLGEEIVKAIRFSLISEKEFASVVLDCDILSKTEICDMIKHYNDVDLKSPVAFMHSPRCRRFHRCNRFAFSRRPGIQDGSWDHNSFLSALKLSVNKSVKLHGVQLFGREGGEYTVFILQVKEESCGSVLVELSGSYFSVKNDTHAYYEPFDVKFDNPVCLETDRTYEILLLWRSAK